MLTGGRNLSISIFFSAVGKGKHDHLHPLYYFIFMHIVSLYRKRSRELHGGKRKGCWKVWPGSGLYFKTLIGFFFNFFINFLSFHVILHYNIYSLITNSTCTDKYQTNYKFNKLLLERLNITFTSNGIREFVPPCRLLFIISAHKLVVSLNFLSIWIFWAVFICSFSILRNSQLDWRLPFAVCCGRLIMGQYWVELRYGTVRGCYLFFY